MSELRGRDGLARFRAQINPEVIEDVLSWRDHPELGAITASLQAHADPRTFFNTYAEAMVARHLLAEGCSLRFEVETPSGRHCDFEVHSNGEVFYLHVKRVNTGRAVRTTLTVSSRLRVLERINRPYIVQVRWLDDLSADQMQTFVTEASAFIIGARVGDEAVIRDHHGVEIGGVRIVAPWDGTHVILAIGLPGGFVNEAPRIRKHLRRAYRQFMPKHNNIVLVCTSHPDDFEDFETALLGTHIERWDADPPEGRRVAHGRDSDGFWHNSQYEESRAAGWFWFTAQDSGLRCRVWQREGAVLEAGFETELKRLFDFGAAQAGK